MNVRPATADDCSGITETVERSLRASYTLSPREIDALVDGAFAGEELESRLDDSEYRLFVAEANDESAADTDLAGFVEVDDDGVLRWLHVHPSARGRGVGTALVDRVEDELESESTPFTARLLEAAREGDQFLERFGLYWTGQTTVEVGGKSFDERVYSSEGDEMDASGPAHEAPGEASIDGETGTVHDDDAVSGTLGPFYPVSDDDADRRLGFFCTQCGTTDVSASGNDRLECNRCRNVHRSDEWDAAYL